MSTPTQLRRDVANLSTLAERDLASVWRQVSSFAAAETALNDVLPSLIETYGLAAATVAADWYDDARLKAGVAGSFQAFPVELPPSDAPVLAGWARGAASSLDSALVLAQGGVQRRITNAARGTVAGSSIADPRAKGWMRVGTGRCDFCRMLISRGAVYTEATAQFRAHDHCGCGAAPAWR